jgi:hypothetical protein
MAIEAFTHILHGGIQRHEVRGKIEAQISDEQAAEILKIAAQRRDQNVIEVDVEEVKEEKKKDEE